ncbi:hypothetical protein BDN72DRAFT_304687 [Pluteus cervinus]|uniref:Uncharacterized protein n=1 Tax=Pluteus cervinus TaxID=181527 RepID=A0ACD3B3J5_9AGAR|nr:hypothetical protein BDN72DRAFT_304687 [Pluteus cervinus]
MRRRDIPNLDVGSIGYVGLNSAASKPFPLLFHLDILDRYTHTSMHVSVSQCFISTNDDIKLPPPLTRFFLPFISSIHPRLYPSRHGLFPPFPRSFRFSFIGSNTGHSPLTCIRLTFPHSNFKFPRKLLACQAVMRRIVFKPSFTTSMTQISDVVHLTPSSWVESRIRVISKIATSLFWACCSLPRPR